MAARCCYQGSYSGSHLKFVQMGGGYLGEPDGGSIIKDSMLSCLSPPEFLKKSKLESAKAFVMLMALEARLIQLRA